MLERGDFVRTTASAQVLSERRVLPGSSLETVRIRSHLLRQFQSNPLSPPARSPRWMAGFLGFLGQTC